MSIMVLRPRGMRSMKKAANSACCVASAARSPHAPRARLPCQAVLLRGYSPVPLITERGEAVRVFGRKDYLQVVPADGKSMPARPPIRNPNLPVWVNWMPKPCPKGRAIDVRL